MSPHYRDSKLLRAMHDPDRWVCRIVYVSADGQRTRRVISPTRFIGRFVLNAICLSREDSRNFTLSQIESLELLAASDVLMPVQIEVLESLLKCRIEGGEKKV